MNPPSEEDAAEKDREQLLQGLREANRAFAERERLLREEISRLSLTAAGAYSVPSPGKEELRSGDVGPSLDHNRRKRDLSLQTMIAPWTGEEGSIPVDEYLDGIELAAEAGNWTEKDKALVARMRLRGAAAAFLASRRDLKGLDADYQAIREGLRERFRDLANPEDYLLKLHALEQKDGEDARRFADRCRALGERAVDPNDPPAVQEIARRQVSRVVLSAYRNGLKGEVGRILRMFPPATLEEAVSRATVVEAEVKKTNPSRVFLAEGGEDLRAADNGGQEVAAVRELEKQPIERDRCYRCGGVGHRVRSCGTPPTEDFQSNSSKSGGAGRLCYRCDRPGHLARDCPSLNRPRNKGEAGYQKSKAVGRNIRLDRTGNSEGREDLKAYPNGAGSLLPPSASRR